MTLPKCDMAEKKRLPNFSSEEIEVLTAGFEKWAKLLFHISFTYLFTVGANDVNYTSITRFMDYKKITILFSIYLQYCELS